MDTHNKVELRRSLRAQRAALTDEQQKIAAFEVDDQLRATYAFHTSRRIACYLATNGEVDTLPLIERIWSLNKTCYLPVLSHLITDRLWFAPVRPDTPLALNRFGIPEPIVKSRQLVPARFLDLILLPLVGFDGHGNRLGMGGGFYDRSLAFLLQRNIWKKPRLIGLAHELQRVDSLPVNPWDIPLQGIVTDKNIYSADNRL